MPLQKDLKEFIESLSSRNVDYLIVGAFALAFHGVPRSTGDIDILVRRSPENAACIESVLVDFSFASLGLSAADFLAADQVRFNSASRLTELICSLPLRALSSTKLGPHASLPAFTVFQSISSDEIV
jgi:hypothetical protein